MRKQIAGKHLPLVLAHRAGSAHGQENSSSAVKESLRYHPDIIEIDVRKTVDQVLFCHHGNYLMSLVYLFIGRFLRFQLISRFIRGVETLEEILTTVQETDPNVIVLLDIKSRSIGAVDVRKSLVKVHIQKVWIAGYTLEDLKRLRKDLGEKHVYVLNRPVVSYRSALKKALTVVDVMHLFPYQWNRRNIDMARRLDLQVVPLLVFPREKFRLAFKGKSLWFGYEDVSSVMYCASEVS